MTKTVTDGNGTTHFFDVYPGKRTRRVNEIIGTAMLFIPLGTTMVEQAPMLVYYHGHNGQGSIERYVKSIPERDFRPKLKSKKVLLVQPWGGHKSTFGQLQTAAGLTTLIDQAMFIALTYGPPVRPMPAVTPPPQSLIAAGFSGGGDALNNVVLRSKGAYLNRLTEAWSFDSMYWAEGKKWVDWANDSANAKKKLRVRVTEKGFGEGTGKPRAQADVIRSAIQASPSANIDIDPPIKATHEELPGNCIPGFL